MFTKSMHWLYRGVAGFGLCSIVFAASVHADSVNLNMDVVNKQDGFVQFQLRAENISLESIYDVVISTNGNIIPELLYGDIEAGKTSTQLVSLDWNEQEEPPSIEWTITYFDNNGTKHTENR